MKATITSNDVTMALIVEYRIALFSSAARALRRRISDFRVALTLSSSAIAFNACDLSMILFIREMSTETKAATAPKRKAGAVTCEMTLKSLVAVGGSGNGTARSHPHRA